MRTTFSSAGGGTRSRKKGSGACTYCGRVHPSKRRRQSMTWESCSSAAIRRKHGVTPAETGEDEKRNKHKNAQRRAEATARRLENLAVVKTKLTPHQQLRKLDARLGTNKGAEKERTKLAKKAIA